MNNVTLTGRIAGELELKKTNSGHSVCTFTLAVKRWGNDDEADFIRVQVWNKQAENLCQYQKKGNRVGVVGRINTREWDRPDGTKGYATEVVANEVEFLTTKRESEAIAQNTSQVYSNVVTQNAITPQDAITPQVMQPQETPTQVYNNGFGINDDDLPF